MEPIKPHKRCGCPAGTFCNICGILQKRCVWNIFGFFAEVQKKSQRVRKCPTIRTPDAIKQLQSKGKFGNCPTTKRATWPKDDASHKFSATQNTIDIQKHSDELSDIGFCQDSFACLNPDSFYFLLWRVFPQCLCLRWEQGRCHMRSSQERQPAFCWCFYLSVPGSLLGQTNHFWLLGSYTTRSAEIMLLNTSALVNPKC